MSYYTSIIKDSPLGFWKLDENAGDVAYDYSGCGNNAQYINFINENIFPLVPQGVSGTTITDSSYIEFPIQKDYYGQSSSESFGTEKTSDNDFSLEAWVFPKNINSLTPILGSTNNIGIYWDNGNIVFSVGSESLYYTLPNLNKTIYIVGVYKKQSISLYIDGMLVKYKKIDSFKFTNSSLLLSAGPCETGQSFIIDAPSVYRYSLSDTQIKNHYAKSFSITPAQIASLNSGFLFKSTEKHQPEADKFIFPLSKKWEYFVNENLSYDEIKDTIYLKNGSVSAEFIEAVSLSIRKSYVSSKIEWLGGEGISVFVSTDETNWTECENGSAIPNINNKKIIYVKVQFQSSDSTIYTPELHYLSLLFYPEKKLFAHNGSGYIEDSQTSGDIEFSSFEYPVLARSKKDGISCKSSGFKLNTLDDILDLEFIFTPKTLSSGYLFHNITEGTEYSLSWASGGTISKSGISELHINGQDVTGASSISSYLNINDSNHIFIKLNSAITGDIWFNVKYQSGAWTGLLDDNVYKNITIYANSDTIPQNNYELYMGNNSLVVEDSDITLTESDINTYSPDWIRISN
jgi:hypothetical protein